MMRPLASGLVALGLLTALAACGGGSDEDGAAPTSVPTAGAGGPADAPKLAFVTNGVASFWVIAEKGAMDAGAATGAAVSVLMPAGGVVDQKRMLEDTVARGVDGVAVSPIDPDNQTDLLDMVASRTNLITHDSDAPGSQRLCYIGMDNYTAGRMCGQLVKEALPDGGEVFIFIGRLEQDNAKGPARA